MWGCGHSGSTCFQDRDDHPGLYSKLLQLDFFFTYTGEDRRLDDKPPDKVAERSDQFGTCLIMASSETKAIHVVPVPSKGTASLKTVTEEVIRFSLENSSRDPCVFQGDSERAMRQILRTVQQVRSVMGLPCEIRLTGSGQHESNGQAERGVQTIRKLANRLRSFAESKAYIQIAGNFHMLPWSFRYASFLVNRFRVLDKVGRTSYELATGHNYRGKLALFREMDMFCKLTQYKGNNTFHRGIWVGKNQWNDAHVILTPEGAFESRTIRWLAMEDSFVATDMVIAKGLPWSYSPQGIMMKHGGQAQRYRQPTLGTEATEEEMKAVTEAIAAGVVTPAPGSRAQPTTPGMPSAAAPMTPAPTSTTPRQKRAVETEEDEDPEAKKLDKETSPRRAHEKREKETVAEESEKKQKTEEEGTTSLPSGVVRERKAESQEGLPTSSPSKIPRLYPPQYAGVQAIEAHGDEEMEDELIPTELTEELLYTTEEADEPPITSDEHLMVMDKEARENEASRLKKIPVMEEANEEDVQSTGGYIISTKFVTCWKHRVEQGGWFRRARLVARQFKSSVDLEQTFAPTSMLVVPKLLIHLMLNVCKEFVAMTLDIKDAFLMAEQPKEERAFVDRDPKIYRLIRCLPGQRTAASQWFNMFANTAKAFGLSQDVMQPTLLMKHIEIYIAVHVDDVFMVGKEGALKDFINFLQEKMKWNVEEKGPFRMGERFHFLKREFKLLADHCDIRCDYKQYESISKDVDVYKKAYRKTPLEQNTKDTSEELQGADITKFRSVVGRLMYMAGERPDVQFASQSLARYMAKPTQQAWKTAWHVCSYLQGTEGFGIRLSARAKGQSVMDTREAEEVEEKQMRLLEIVTDADYAGNKNDRKSTTSFQVFLDGNLMESRVEAKRAFHSPQENQSLSLWWVAVQMDYLSATCGCS